ncbi:MAG TPA: sigma-70 family RNA polymerase sigma factor, partial [Planctomycetota bacterium]
MDRSPDLHSAALRRLARGLVFDEARAKDVVQEAWLAAVRRRPAPEGLRAWLAEAVRRIARSTGRDELRRARREERAARPEALPSAAEASARIEVLRRLLAALDALEEPYRTAIVLRYFDDLPPRRIAARLGLPVNTVRTHVRRGLEKLRRALDGPDGAGRTALLGALLPLVGAPPRQAALPEASLSHTAGVLVAKPVLAVLVLVTLVLAGWYLAPPPAEHGERRAPAGAVASVAAHDPVVAPGDVVAFAGETREPTGASAHSTAAWTVRGHVLRSRGEPFALAELAGRVFRGADTRGPLLHSEALQADEQGDFAWSIEPPGELVTIQVVPTGAELHAHGAEGLFLPGDPPPERWVVHAYPLDRIVHAVVRDAEGRPVAGARVVHEQHPEPRELRTATDGSFTLATASARDFHPVAVLAEGFAAAHVELQTLLAGPQPGEIVLRSGPTLRGRVLDPTGTPLEGVRISARIPLVVGAATSDAEGRFELAGMPAASPSSGAVLFLKLEKEGFASCLHMPVPDARGEVELRMERGAGLAGRVLAPDGTPVAGALVSLGLGGEGPRAFTDGAGGFELGPAPSGPQELWVWRTGFAQLRHDLEVPPDAVRLDGLELHLRPARFLGGLVLDERGQPRPWTFVQVRDPDKMNERLSGFAGYTDGAGRFRFDGLPDVRVQVMARAPGFAPAEEWLVGLDRDDLVLRLAPAARLCGRVVEAGSGAPVPSFTLRLRRARSGEGLQSWVEGLPFASADGTWWLEDDLDAGEEFFVTVHAPGHADGLGRATASTAPRPDDCRIELVPGARVRGHVRSTPDGRALTGARVRASQRVLETIFRLAPRETETDASGAFELVDLNEGEWTLRVEHEGLGAVDGPFHVAGTETVE